MRLAAACIVAPLHIELVTAEIFELKWQQWQLVRSRGFDAIDDPIKYIDTRDLRFRARCHPRIERGGTGEPECRRERNEETAILQGCGNAAGGAADPRFERKEENCTDDRC